MSVGAPEANALPAATSADGVCLNSDGVTVVVDFEQLGGATIERCVTGLPAGATGIQALAAAGVTVTGVTGQAGVVCRLDDKPSATQTIPVKGNTDYHEACAKFPPANAYWSYWQAKNGGKWAYANAGPDTQKVIPGGFEGWSFSLNTTNSPAPRVAPVYATGGKMTGTAASQPFSSGSSTGSASTSSHSSAPATTTAPSSAASSSAAASSKSSSSHTTTIVAIVVLVLLVIAALVVAALRRKQQA